jgi:hypothetical protein
VRIEGLNQIGNLLVSKFDQNTPEGKQVAQDIID